MEEQPLSRTSGRKYASDDKYLGEYVDKQCGTAVVRMRKNQVPPITSHLIIPVVLVAKTALTTRNVMENAGNEMEVQHNSDGHSGESFIPFCIQMFSLTDHKRKNLITPILIGVV